jgi:hypothetical protein
MSAKAQDQSDLVASIQEIDYPKHVSRSETFDVTVQVTYNFPTPSSLQVSIYNQENTRLATLYSGALIYKGVTHFDLRVTAPNQDVVWNLFVNLYIQNSPGGEIKFINVQNISIVVGSPGIAAPSFTEEFTTTSYSEESVSSTSETQITTSSYFEQSETSSSASATIISTDSPTTVSEIGVQGIVDSGNWMHGKLFYIGSVIIGTWAAAVILIIFIVAKWKPPSDLRETASKKRQSAIVTHACPSCEFRWIRPRAMRVGFCPRCGKRLFRT